MAQYYYIYLLFFPLHLKVKKVRNLGDGFKASLNNNIKVKIAEFNQNTLPISTFQIEEVIEDGACFYRALAIICFLTVYF